MQLNLSLRSFFFIILILSERESILFTSVNKSYGRDETLNILWSDITEKFRPNILIHGLNFFRFKIEALNDFYKEFCHRITATGNIKSDIGIHIYTQKDRNFRKINFKAKNAPKVILLIYGVVKNIVSLTLWLVNMWLKFNLKSIIKFNMPT